MFSPLFSPVPAGGAVVFDSRKEPALVLERLTAFPKLAGVTAASRLEVRPTPEMVSSGIGEIDELTGGLPRGCLSEICGSASSGRTSVLLSALAAATRRQEVCALVDTTDALDAVSAAAAGVELEKLLWIRCSQASGVRPQASGVRPQTSDFRPGISDPEFGDIEHNVRGLRSDVRCRKSDVRGSKSEARLEQALRVTDLLLQSGGFGLVAIDLGDVPDSAARRIPLASWFRFQRAVEPTATVLLVVAQAPCAQTCASVLIRLGGKLSAFSYQLSVKDKSGPDKSGPAHAQLLSGLQIEGELLRSRLQRKPAQSVSMAFATRAVRIA
jgi:recA bacterial DNA recombination protein